MADPVPLTSAVVWLGGYAIEGQINNIDLKASRVEKPNSRMGDLGETFYPGLVSCDAKVAGFWDEATIGAPLFPRLDTDSAEWPLTIGPPAATAAAAGADGNTAYTIRSAQYSLPPIKGAHGDLLPFDLTSRMRGGSLYRQTIVLPKATYAATSTGTGRTLGLLAATQKLVLTVHVFAIVGGSWVFTVESDDNAPFATPVVRMTMAAVTTAPYRLVTELVGPVATDTFWRVVLTKTGGTSITAAALLSIEPA
jgi:hypothetical protein